MTAERIYEIRDPVHGFIAVDGWERDLIGQPAFQRLRRIRQLGWTEMVYPGATHTRFAHSLGVMHVATRLFDAIWARDGEFLAERFGADAEPARLRRLVRFAALLHDVGHGPFSHAAEELMPERPRGGRWTHEDYSAAIARVALRDALEDHPANTAFGIKLEEIESLFRGRGKSGLARLLRSLVAGQIDADRMDYLLRDSHYCGVEYGRFDLDRIVATAAAVERGDGRLAVGATHGGRHAVEGLLIARYMMFTQVYFHKTRRVYDHHLERALRAVLAAEGEGGTLPPPDTDEGVRRYLAWDDWRVLGALAAGAGGEDGARLTARDHWRLVWESPETPSPQDLELVERARALGADVFVDEAARDWHAPDKEDVWIRLPNQDGRRGAKLSTLSTVAKNLPLTRQLRLYAAPERRAEVKTRIHALPPTQGALF